MWLKRCQWSYGISLYTSQKTQPNSSTVYLDNFRFTDSTNTLTALRSASFEALRLLTVVCPLHEYHIEQVYTFLGMVWDHIRQTVGVNARLKEKISALDIEDKPQLREVVAHFAVLMCASRILRLSLAEYYYVFKFIRRKARTTGWYENVTLWHIVKPTLKKWEK